MERFDRYELLQFSAAVERFGLRQRKEMRAGLDAAICGLEQAMETFTEPSDGNVINLRRFNIS